MCSLNKKKILLVSEWYSPAYKAGGPIQSIVGMAELLSEHAKVWVIAGSKDLGEIKHLDVQRDSWLSFAENIQVRYSDPKEISFRFWKSVFDEIEPDWLHLNSLYSLRFSLTPLLLSRLKPKTKVVLAPRGMLGKAARRIKPGKKALFLSLSKSMGLFSSIGWHASTYLESREIKEFIYQAQVGIAQDLPVPLPQDNPARSSERWRVVIIGRIHRV